LEEGSRLPTLLTGFFPKRMMSLGGAEQFSLLSLEMI
jgi:hypothetical protein